MIHFFKRSKIHLDAFTNSRNAMEFSPVVNGMETIPNWWKKLPKQYLFDNFIPMPTMKTCVGVQDFYAKSIAVPLWSDFVVKVHEKSYSWQFSDDNTEAKVHLEEQYDGYLNGSDYGHVKIVSPWLFSTKDDINWMSSDGLYNRTDFRSYTLANGLLNFSKQPRVNLQLFIDTSKNYSFTIPFNFPFLFTPLTEKEVVIHRHLVSNEKFNSISQRSVRIKFINKYRAAQKTQKCPFNDYFFKAKNDN